MSTVAGSTWAHTYDFRASALAHPTSVDEVREVVAGTERVRALGSRHTFTALADTPGLLVQLDAMPTDIEIDGTTARIPGGLRYGDAAEELQARGWALHNLASLPHISVAGTVATGTHGSGDRNGTLSSAVAALDLVTASGDLLHLARGDDDFPGSVVSLGALGVVTHVTLDIQPTFEVRQDLYSGLSWDALLDRFDDITGSAYSVSVFTNWLGNGPKSLWLKSRMTDAVPPVDLFGAKPVVAQAHMLADQPAANTTTQGGVPGPWSERLAHFKLGFTPSHGDEIQSEYLVPRENAIAAITAMRELGPRFTEALLVTELRTMAADDLWLSGAYGRDTVGVHFTWKRLPEAVAALLPLIEERLLPLGARPHWGKTFATTELDAQYPRMDDFRALIARVDPGRKFASPYLERFGI